MRLGGGNQNARVNVISGDELGVLASTFNLLLDQQSEDRLRVEEQRSHLCLIMNNSLDAIITITSSGNVVEYNQAAENLFGFTKEEVKGKPLAQFIIPENLRQAHIAAIKKHTKNSLSQKTIQRRVDLVAQCKDGSIVDVEIIIASYIKSSQAFFIAFLRDVTERKQLLQTLKESLSVAEASNATKSEFLANMSHEIRTPMNAIIGMTDIVLQTELTKKQKEFLTIVSQSSQNLLQLINQILDLSKIEAGQIIIEQASFDLLGRVESWCESLAFRAHSKGVELHLHFISYPPPTLMGDPVRLRQVIINLIGNAIKFTEDGEVVVTIKSEQPDEDGICTLHFSVADTGIGVSPEDQSNIFDRFTQVDASATRKFGGTGLGLAISKNLVALMGGVLEVSSTPNQGSVFFFSLQLKNGNRKEEDEHRQEKSVQEEKRTRYPNESTLKGVNVLVLIPSATGRNITTSYLKAFGAHVKELATTDQFRNHQEQQKRSSCGFHILIVDHEAVTSFSSIDQLIKNSSVQCNVVLLVPQNWVHLSMYAGANANVVEITKPLRRFELLNAINWILGRAHLNDKVKPRDLEIIKSQMRPAKILLAEDMKENQVVATTILESVGHSIVAVTNGKEALSQLEKEGFDLILMDLQMPIMDGLEVTTAIRHGHVPAQKNIPIVAISAHVFKEQQDEFMLAGVNAFLKKPYRMIELLTTILPFVKKPVAPRKKMQEKAPTPLFALPEASNHELSEITKTFFENTPKQLALLRSAVDKEDRYAFVKHADIIKAQASNIGAKKIKILTIKLKSTLETKAWSEVSKDLNELEQKINEVLVALNQQGEQHGV